jgi:ABC-type nitrate/sulfonate/bicarbonate transport system ATPase subunit
MSVLAGWTPPVEGTVRSQGVQRTGWIFQNPHGVPGRTALDHVALPLLARGYDFKREREATPLFWEYLRFQREATGIRPSTP